jgi:hypothetical protein
VRVNGTVALRSVGNAAAHINPNISINIGDVVDIIGNWSPAVTGNFTAHNSYAASGIINTTIEGVPHTMRRTGWQWDIGDASWESGTYLTPSTTQPGRIFMYTLPTSNDPGACCFPTGGCQLLPSNDCIAQGGVSRGPGTDCASANCPQPGACCLNDGTCTFVVQTACTAAIGVWAGAGVTCAAANCPAAAACCFFTSCAVLTPAACASQGGVSIGSAASCATANCPTYEIVETSPGTFTDIGATGSIITSGDDSSVAFVSSVTNALVPSQNMWASTNGVISSVQFTTWTNTALPVQAAGRAMFPLWDDLFADPAQNGAVLHQAVVENGINVHIVQWNNVRTFAGGAGGLTGRFQVKIFESGPVLIQYIYDDVSFAAFGTGATIGYQAAGAIGNELQHSFNTASIQNGTVLSIVAAGGGVCYANCDGSSIAPVLNVDDFTCFVNEFASAQSLPHEQQVGHYANCDGSTVAPALNVDDFTCFVNQFAQGCP